MVLAELGSKVAFALRKMTQATVVDQQVMNDMLNEICRALLQADVNVSQVKRMKEAINKQVDVEALAGGLNKRKMLEQAVCNELISMLDPGREPYKPRKTTRTPSAKKDLPGSWPNSTEKNNPPSPYKKNGRVSDRMRGPRSYLPKPP